MIEQMERRLMPEQEIEPDPLFDAILVHGYWMSEPEPGDVRLALRSRLAVRTAALAYNEGSGARHIVLPVGKMWGANYDSMGNLMADELEHKYGVAPQAIIREGDAYSTGGEVKTFLNIAQKNGWTKLLDIAFSDHQRTIPAIYKEYGGEDLVTMDSVEEILQENDHHLVSHLVKRINKSHYGKTFRYIYEPLKRLRMKIPGFTYDSLELANKKSRTHKGKDFFIPLDVYKL